MTVAIYARLSPKPNGDYEGVEDQEKWGRQYAATTWPGEPVEVFADKGKSAGRDDVRRADFERLREWISAGKLRHVWVVEQSRITRHEIEWFEFAAELDAAGITEVHTNRDGVVRVGDDVAGIKAVLNAGERRKMLRRLRDTLTEKAAKGEPPGVKPFGYIHGYIADDQHLGSRCNGPACEGCRTKTYEVVPEQAAVIRYAAAKVLSGWSLASVAAEMNKPAAGRRDPELLPTTGGFAEAWKDGILGVHGGKVTAGAVKNWLTVPTVAGLRQHSGEIVGDGNWPAILDKATHRTLKARLTGERAVKRTGGGTYSIGSAHKGFVGRKYLLTGGLAVCGHNGTGEECGVPLTGAPQTMRKRKGETERRTHPYLLCHPKNGGKGHLGIMLPEVEEYVVDELFKHLDSPEFLDAVGAEDDHDEERERLVTELSAIEARRKELASMWAQRQLTTSEWQTAKAAMDEQEHQMAAALAAIPTTSGRVDVAAVRKGWAKATLDEQREFIRDHIAKVTIHPATKMGPGGLDTDRVEIDWRRTP